MNIAIIFPGQGSQQPNMGKDFYEKYKEKVEDIYNKANNILGYDIKEIIFNSSTELLSQTEYSQPSIFITSYIVFELLKMNFDLNKVKFLAGHSLGEYTAICAAGCLDFESTLDIIKVRAKIMSEIGKKKPGGMLAVLGLDRLEVMKYCNEIKSLGFVVEPVNFNTPQQIVVSGEIEAINKFQSLLNENKIKNIKLNVSGAFHSSLMNEAQIILSQYIDKIKFEDAKIPIISNYDAKPHIKKEEIINNLKLQINHPVLWEDSVKFMLLENIDIFIECGPGKVLTGMIKKISPNSKSFNIDNIDNLITTIDNLKQFF